MSSEQHQQSSEQQNAQQQSERLAQYNAWIEPFKLYLEWPEMHKLRAQLQLISAEVGKSEDTQHLFDDAKKQKRQLSERYQDALLIQSESIVYLERGLSAFKNLDDVKYKRLKRICETLKESQAAGRIAEAEQDRGDELVKELRLQAVAKGIPVEIALENKENSKRGILNWARRSKNVEKEVVSFEELELAEQSRYLEKLAQRYANVFDYRRDLSKQLRALRKKIKEEVSIASDLATFQDYLKVAKNELRNQLKAELTEIDQSLENMQKGLEIQALTRALKVTTQILNAALPDKADVKEIRDHHRMLMQQTQAFSNAPKKQAAPQEKKKKRSGRGMGKLEQQEEALEEFVSTFNSYQRFVEDDIRRAFAAQIADLKRASRDNRYDLEMISEGHRFAATFEASALMQSHDERSMQRDQLQEWIAELRAMPRVDTLRQKFHDTLRSFQGLSERMNHEDVNPETFETYAVSIQDLRDDLKAHLENDFDYLNQQVSLLDDVELKQKLELASRDLKKNYFSSTVDIHHQVRLACDRALSNQLSELHRLEAESNQLLSDNEEDLDTLHDQLDLIRGQIEAGKISQGLPDAWEMLEKARSQHDDWIVKFEARLDRLIDKASKIAFLNTSSSFKLISLLSHLDEQRDIFTKVSIKARRRLEESLETAKVELRQLRKEQQLAQSLAQELANVNPLDNMFGDINSGDMNSGDMNSREVTPSFISAGPSSESAASIDRSSVNRSNGASPNVLPNVSASELLDSAYDGLIDEDYVEESENPFDSSLSEVLDSRSGSFIEGRVNEGRVIEGSHGNQPKPIEAQVLQGSEAYNDQLDLISEDEFEVFLNDDIDSEIGSITEIDKEIAAITEIDNRDTYEDISSDLADDVRAELDIHEHGELRLTEVRSDYPSLDRWLDDYLQDGSVRDAMIYSREGELLAAKSWLDPDASLKSFSLLNNVAKNLGRNLGLGRYHLASVETSNRVFLGVRLRGGSSMLLLLDNTQSLHPVSNRLRRDIPTLGRMIHEAALN